MNKEERVLNVLNRKPVDFLPSQITFSDRTRDKEVSEALGLSGPEELDDYLENHIYFTYDNNDKHVFYRNDLEVMEDLQKRGFAGIDYNLGIVYDCYGMGLQMHNDGVWAIYGALKHDEKLNKSAMKYLPPSFNRDLLSMNTEDAIKNYKTPDPEKDGTFNQMGEDLKKHSGDFLVIPSGYFGIFERAYALMGFEEFMIDLIDRRNMVEEFLEKLTDYRVEEAKKKVALGFKVGHAGDDFGTQVAPFFSEKMFVEVFKPKLARVFKVFKDAGLPVVMHSCGNITPYLPHLIDIGLDAWEPVQPCNDLEYIKKEYGQYLTFWGGIDTQRLPFMKPQEVKEMARYTIRTLGKGGGHIIAPAQEIMSDVPIENVKALVETIIEERKHAIE